MKYLKYILVLGVIFLTGGTYILGTQITKPKVKSETVINEVTPTVTPTTGASESSLKVAAKVVMNSTKSYIAEAKTKYGNAKMTDTDLIRLVAEKMDKDPAYKAQVEAVAERNGNQTSTDDSYTSSTQTYSAPTVKYETPKVDLNAQFRQDCLERQSKYTTCVAEYSAKLSEYNTCEHEKATNEYKKYTSCLKPFNMCGGKPICF